MGALLAELAPARPRNRIWPYVAVAAVVAGGAGAAAMTLWHRGSARPQCSAVEGERAQAAWSPQQAREVGARFAKTGRSYADQGARVVVHALDGYSAHWRQLAGDVCTAERAAERVPDLVVRRRACLDQRLDALRGLVSTLTGEVTPELVDHAADIAKALPELGECDASAPELPPPAIAAEVAKLQVDLGTAMLHTLIGQRTLAKAEAAAVRTRADAIGWPVLRARAALVLGQTELNLMEPARAEILSALSTATAHHLDHVVADVLPNLLLTAEGPSDGELVAVIGPLAHAAAVRIGDRRAELHADICEGRALARIRRWREAAKQCEAAERAAVELDDAAERVDAQACRLEALVPLDELAQTEPLIASLIAEQTKELGPDHPVLADYLHVQLDVDVRQGNLVEARRAGERALAILKKVYPPTHFKIAVALEGLGDVAESEGKRDEARSLFEQALALTDETRADQLVTIVGLHQQLALFDAPKRSPRHAAALAHLEKAVALLRAHAGNDDPGLGVLLLTYGQIKVSDDHDAGLAMLVEGRNILERNHDKRAPAAAVAIALMHLSDERYEDARTFAEDALARFDPDASIDQIAVAKETLALALAGLHRDRARSRQLAIEARAVFLKLGPGYASSAARLAALAK